MKLTRQGFEKARVFMKETSRDLDRRIFEYRFEGAPRDRALEALATYANPDGGFGHGLEADVRAEASSPAVTAWAFQTLREVDAPSKHALVRRGIRFFLRTYIDRLEGWPRVVPGFNDAPREPHWRYDPVTVAQEARTQWAWPSAEIVGYLYDYPDLVPPTFLARVSEKTRGYVESRPPEELHPMEIFAVEQLAASAPGPLHDLLLGRITRAVKHSLPPPDEWRNTRDGPLFFVTDPEDPLAPILEPDIRVSLDQEVEAQGQDGSFAPAWTAHSKYGAEWNSRWTLRVLIALKAYGRIEGVR